MSLLEFFLLREAERTARGYGAEQHARIQTGARAARKYRSAAREVSRPGQLESSLVLYREALVACAEAHLAHQGKEAHGVLDARAALETLFGSSPSESAYETLVDALDGRAAGLRRTAIRRAARSADRTVDRALRLFESRSVGRIQIARAVRAGTVLASAVALALLLVAWVRKPRNVLRGKPVTASGTELGAPESMVNGAVEWGTYAWTSNEGAAWLTVDLEGTYPIRRVRIFNRGDAHFERQVPVHIELLDEQKALKDAADCTEQFSQASPCVVSMKGTPARYLRASHNGQMVLSEIEAYGP